MTKRRALYIDWSPDVERMVQTIAAYIIALAPKDPLFPPPLRPTASEAEKGSQFSVFEVCACCARLLARHIKDGEDIDMKVLLDDAQSRKKAAILPVLGAVPDDFYSDLVVIYDALNATGNLAYASRGDSINLKTPLMVAITYAYAYVGGDEE
jgi:hypothetical protein